MDIASELLIYGLSIVALFGLTFTLSLAVVGVLLVKLPATYFLDSQDRQLWVDHHPAARLLLHVMKNLLGLGLVGLGLLLSLPGIPGQGLLTALIGLMLVDFPGKRGLERRLIGRPRVLRTVNRLRQRYGKAPFLLQEPTRAG